LIFDHNRHEVEAARKLAGKLGVDVFRAKPGVVPERYKEAWHKATGCSFLYDTIAMQVDGGLVSCCHLYDKKDDFVPGPAASFTDVWHDQSYEVARKLFRPDLVGELDPDLKHPCLNCSLVQIQPHLAHLKGVAGAPELAPAGAAVTPTIAVRGDVPLSPTDPSSATKPVPIPQP
jgi:hypothetical protein